MRMIPTMTAAKMANPARIIQRLSCSPCIGPRE
jgi:hypothetical protein